MKNNRENNVLTLDPRLDSAQVLSASTSENCLPIGTKLAEFDIIGIVGEGGFGTVYLATDRSLQRTVAIKEYMPGALAARGPDKSVIVRSKRHQETFDVGLKSFINEARLLAQFDHPALIKVHRFWEENKTGYMAMRYYEGDTLKSVVKNRPEVINEAWLKNMLKPVLDALELLYKMQVLHRDVSPDNIMIQHSGHAVLLDFGAARQIIGDATQALTVILKPGYAPIEQYADDSTMKQGAWTDIYALSAVIYYCIVKKPPPTSVARMLKDPIKALRTLAPAGYTNQFLAAIDRGLSVNPDHRPQSIDEFRRLLWASTDDQASEPIANSDPTKSATRPENTAKSPVENIEKKTPPRQQTEKIIGLISARPAVPERALPNRKKFPKALIVCAMIAMVATAAAFTLAANRKASKPGPLPVAIAPPAPVEPPPQPVAKPDPVAVEVTPPAPDDETLAWDNLKANSDAKAADLTNFVQKYPIGKYTEEAKVKLAVLTAVPPLPPSISATVTTDVPPKITGTVKLAISPWGKISVDGYHRGITPPLKKLALSEGKHQIKISNPNFPDYITEIDVSKNIIGNVTHEFSPDLK